MSTLFSPVTINKITLNNRFVRSAAFVGLATPSGGCTSALGEMWANLAKGGVGLIITGHVYVEKLGKADIAVIGTKAIQLLETRGVTAVGNFISDLR